MVISVLRVLLALIPLAGLAGCGSDGAGSPELPSPPDPNVVAGGLDGELLESLGKLTAAVNGRPSDPSAWEALGQAYETSRVFAGAHVAFGAAASLKPSDPKLWYRAAITAARFGEVELALERLASSLKLAPDYGPAWRRKGTWLLDLGRTDEAKPAFERANELLPERSDAVVGLARVALAEDRVGDALELARLALERSPGDAYVRSILGNALRRSGMTDEARPHLVAGQGSTPTYVDPWSEEAVRSMRKDEDALARVAALQAEGRFDESIALIRKAIEDSPGNSNLPLRLGVALMQAKRVDEAILHYDAAVGKFPGNYDLAAGRAAALRSGGRVSEALKAADDLISRWPDRPAAYLQRGSALADLGDVPAARAAFQRASELQSSDLRGPLFEGRMLARLKRYREAVEVLSQGLDLPGASPPLVYFKNLLAAQAAAGADRAALEATVARARRFHGDAVNSLLR